MYCNDIFSVERYLNKRHETSPVVEVLRQITAVLASSFMWQLLRCCCWQQRWFCHRRSFGSANCVGMSNMWHGQQLWGSISHVQATSVEDTPIHFTSLSSSIIFEWTRHSCPSTSFDQFRQQYIAIEYAPFRRFGDALR